MLGSPEALASGSVHNAPLEYAVTLGDERSRLVYDDELHMLPGWGVADSRYVVIVDVDGNRCGGVVRCASSPDDVRLSRATERADVLVAMRPEFAGRGILSSFLRSGALREVFPDLRETTLSLLCLSSRGDYEAKLHLAELAGLEVTNRADCETALGRGGPAPAMLSYDDDMRVCVVDDMRYEALGCRLRKGCYEAERWLAEWFRTHGEVPLSWGVPYSLLLRVVAFQDAFSELYAASVEGALRNWVEDGLRCGSGVTDEDVLREACEARLAEMADAVGRDDVVCLPDGMRERESMVDDATEAIFGEVVPMRVLEYFDVRVGRWCAFDGRWHAGFFERHMLNALLRVADYCRETGICVVV